MPADLRLYGLHQRLAHEISILLRAALFQDDDILLVFDGHEGAGKSKFMRQVGYFCQQKLKEWGIEVPYSVDNGHFDLIEYINTSNQAESLGYRGFVNILDESRNVANRKRSNSREAVLFTNFLSEARSANQIHLIGLPAYHDLDSYIVRWRMKLLIHIEKYFEKDKDNDNETGYRLKRGNFKVFLHGGATSECYASPRRYNYPRTCEFSGTFSADEPPGFDLDAYDNKKRKFKYLKYGGGNELEVDVLSETQRHYYDLYKQGMKLIDIAKTVGRAPSTVSVCLTRAKKLMAKAQLVDNMFKTPDPAVSKNLLKNKDHDMV